MDTKLLGALRAAKEEILGAACEALGRAHLVHYEDAGPGESRERLGNLLRLVEDAVTERSLLPISRYAQHVAEERFRAGFDVGEVQSAFNVLEEAIWQAVVMKLAPDELVEGAGLVGTILGAGKDSLARTWVSLASAQHVTSLDLTAMFEGAAG